MTRAYDVRQLIAEQAGSTAERRALEEMADHLQESLVQEVPYRPEFREQLRRRLMSAARVQLTPWYRRPSFLGSGAAVAAAAAVLVVGLNLWQKDQIRRMPPQAPGQGAEASRQAPQAEPPQSPFVTLVKSLPMDLKQPLLPDEPLPPTAEGPVFTGADARQLQLKQLTARPGAEEFRAMANRLAFRGESRSVSGGWIITDESRTLSMSDDGRVGYSHTAPAASPSAPAIDAEGARQAAFRFLDQALLPVHTGQPAVTPRGDGFDVVYVEQVDGRPVVNAKTTVAVTAAGDVAQAEAYVASGVTTEGTYVGVGEEEAIAAAASGGGDFSRADLVWARTPGEGAIYLQPYWRVFGTDRSGKPVMRYVPALKP